MTPGPLLLTPYQQTRLLEAIPTERVSVANKQSHLEQWDVRRTLTRFFGIGGWRVETKRLWLIAQVEVPPGSITQTKWVDGKKYDNVPNDKTVWTVVYGAEVRLTVYGLNGSCASFEDGATGDSQNQPTLGDAHDMALKTALSQAMKRCAVNLGDQFGLSLYNKGNRSQVVHGTLAPYLLIEPSAPAALAAAAAALPERDEQVETSHDPTLDHGGEGVDTAEPIPADHVQRAREDLDRLTAQTAAPAQSALDDLAARRARAEAMPDDDDTIENAAARAIRQKRETVAAERTAARAQTPAPTAPPTAPPADGALPVVPGEPVTPQTYLSVVYAAHSADDLRALWPFAEGLPHRYRTDLRPWITPEAAAVLGSITGEAFPSAVHKAAKVHLDAEGMSVRDHLAAEAEFAAERPDLVTQGATP